MIKKLFALIISMAIAISFAERKEAISMSKKIGKRRTLHTNRTPAVPTLWKLICRRPSLSVWSKNPFKRDSHKKTGGTIKAAPKPPKSPKPKKRG